MNWPLPRFIFHHQVHTTPYLIGVCYNSRVGLIFIAIWRRVFVFTPLLCGTIPFKIIDLILNVNRSLSNMASQFLMYVSGLLCTVLVHTRVHSIECLPLCLGGDCTEETESEVWAPGDSDRVPWHSGYVTLEGVKSPRSWVPRIFIGVWLKMRRNVWFNGVIKCNEMFDVMK